MAPIRIQGKMVEIRECRTTERGPRQVALARFSGVLTPEIHEQARSRAQRPFDAAAVAVAARQRGVPVASGGRQTPAARRLLAEMRQGATPHPTIVRLLREALDLLPEHSLPAHLEDASHWLGESQHARGKAFRGLLRTASRIIQSRTLRQPERGERFPRFSSGRPAN